MGKEAQTLSAIDLNGSFRASSFYYDTPFEVGVIVTLFVQAVYIGVTMTDFVLLTKPSFWR